MEEELRGLHNDNDTPRVKMDGDRLVYSIKATRWSRSPVLLGNVLWWMERTGLPIVLHVDNAHFDALNLFSTSMRSRVVELSIDEEWDVKTMRSASAPAEVKGTTVLTALSTFSNLTKLSIMCKSGVGESGSAASVRGALSMLAHVPLAHLIFHQCADLHDLSGIAALQHLRSLAIRNCGLQDVSALALCPRLVNLDVSCKGSLDDLSALASAPCLERLTAASMDLG